VGLVEVLQCERLLGGVETWLGCQFPYDDNAGRLGCWLHQGVHRNMLAGSKYVGSISRIDPVGFGLWASGFLRAAGVVVHRCALYLTGKDDVFLINEDAGEAGRQEGSLSESLRMTSCKRTRGGKEEVCQKFMGVRRSASDRRVEERVFAILPITPIHIINYTYNLSQATPPHMF
jgi:hypothetical protein